MSMRADDRIVGTALRSKCVADVEYPSEMFCHLLLAVADSYQFVSDSRRTRI
jgi:hypothetical protein